MRKTAGEEKQHGMKTFHEPKETPINLYYQSITLSE